MARIEVDPRTGRPRCPGCGREMFVLPWFLDSSRRGPDPFDGTGESWGPRVAQFAAEHVHCPEPARVRKVERSGELTVVDRRVR